MSVVYRTDLAVVHHADARDVLSETATESVDLLVTDPPYGVEWVSSRRSETFGGILGDGSNEREGVREILADAIRCVKQSRHAYVFGPPEILDGLKVSSVARLVWDKGSMTPGDLTSPWGAAHEPLSFVVSQHRHAGKAGKETNPVRLRKGSVLRYGRRTGRTVRHPSEKPVDLLSELVESSSRVGETVLDPFAGVGSTGVAAVLRGRRAILVEADERWIPIVIDRIRRAEEIAHKMAEI